MADVPISSGKRRIIRKLPSQGSHDRAAGIVGEVEERIHIRQNAKPNHHGRPRRFRNAGPDISFLGDCGEGVVVAVEGEEGAELHPAVTEFFVRVAVEAAGVDAEHWDAEKGEAQSLRLGIQVSALRSRALWIDGYRTIEKNIYAHKLVLSPPQCPAHFPAPAKVDLPMIKGRLPGMAARRALYVALRIWNPNKLCTSYSSMPPTPPCVALGETAWLAKSPWRR